MAWCPGNIGRNYVCRMIIRRAARFGSKIGLHEPFLAQVAEEVIENYGDFYPELVRNREAILSNLTREEERFQRTVESGVAKLENLLDKLTRQRRARSCPATRLSTCMPPTACRWRSPATSPASRAWKWMSRASARPWKSTAWLPAPARPLARWAARTSISTAS